MTDSLDNGKAFEELKFNNVLTLLDVLNQAKLTTLGYVKKRFLERAQSFEAALAFLLEVGVVSKKGTNLSFNVSTYDFTVGENRESISTKIIIFLTRSENRYRHDVFNYLKHFVLQDGRAVYKSSTLQRSAESAVRNFLMEIGIVDYDRSEDCYFITSEYPTIYLQAKNKSNVKITPLQFEATKKDREDIGFAAELAVLEFERQRVGRDFASKVEHVAAKNVAAGYDIKSVSLSQAGKEEPRYVEVKAVPKSTYRFYWSSNERKIAELFGSHYFLYLLPVGKDGRMNLEDLLIVKEPFIAILKATNKWTIEYDVLKCSLNLDTTLL